MKKQVIKANNFHQVKEAFEEMGGGELINEINSEIIVEESKHYHIVLIRIISNEESMKNDADVRVVIMHQQGFERLQENFESRYSKMIVLHNPEEEIGDVIDSEETKDVGVSEEEVQKRIDAALENQKKEIENKTQEDLQKLSAKLGVGKIDISGLIESDATKDAMEKFAEDNGLTLAKTRTKPDTKQSLIDAVKLHNDSIVSE